MNRLHEIKEWAKMIVFLILLVCAVAAIFAAVFLQPYFEAQAFNKFTTGPKATYWDAMWSSLRVQAK